MKKNKSILLSVSVFPKCSGTASLVYFSLPWCRCFTTISMLGTTSYVNHDNICLFGISTTWTVVDLLFALLHENLSKQNNVCSCDLPWCIFFVFLYLLAGFKFCSPAAKYLKNTFFLIASCYRMLVNSNNALDTYKNIFFFLQYERH